MTRTLCRGAMVIVAVVVVVVAFLLRQANPQEAEFLLDRVHG